MSAVIRKGMRQFFPETVKTFLIGFTGKEAFFLFPGIKTEATGLVQVKDRIQTVAFGPADSALKKREALFPVIPLLILEQFVIERDADMVQSRKRSGQNPLP